MGISTAAIVGISLGSLVLGAGAGGGAVAYYHYRKKERERQEIENYIRSLHDMNLRGKTVRARLNSYNN